MAQIKQEMLIVKVSTLVKDGEIGEDVFNNEIVSALEEAITDMVGNGYLVEIIADRAIEE